MARREDRVCELDICDLGLPYPSPHEEQPVPLWQGVACVLVLSVIQAAIWGLETWLR